MLSLGCITFLFLMGLLSYKINNSSYAYFTDKVQGKETIEMTYVKPNLDKSGANAPLLSSNMISVYYDETSDAWRKADSTNSDKKYKWYDYNNKMWANAVTVKENSKIGESITKNKSVSLTNKTISVKLPNEFTSGGYNVNNADSRINITVRINTAGTFGFKATVSSESKYDKLTVTVTKNSGHITTVMDGASGESSNTFSDSASVGDTYVITAKYAKDSSGNSGNDNGVLDSFTYPSNTLVSYTTSSDAGGNAHQDWTVVEKDFTSSGVIVGDNISYSESSGLYDLNNTSTETISSSLVGKYVCPTVTEKSCEKPYKITEASSTITKVDEYVAKAFLRNYYVDANLGTEIPMDAINAMWVWIPRYTYTYLNTNTPEEIKIKFEKGTTSSGTISCTDAINQTDSDGNAISEVCTDSVNGSLKAGTSTYTHPAFWWDKNDNSKRESGEELTGIWVGKFEVSSDTDCNYSDNADVGSGCNLTTIRPNIIPNAVSWQGAMVGTFFNDIYNMRESGNKYGFNKNDETHMMKNTEWGAVTYLYHSKYGRCESGTCTEVTKNNCSSHLTGIAADSIKSDYSTSTCTTDANKYNGEKGVLASTTGNIYGIYDMSGGVDEYMMSDLVYTDGTMMSGYTIYGGEPKHSGFTGYLSQGGQKTLTYDFPSKRYYDSYSYLTKGNEYEKLKLGDATKEMAPSNWYGWYNDYAYLPSTGGDSWFIRGGNYVGSYVGLFYFNGYFGNAFSVYSTRAVISNLN